jgi:hypothetical protein
VKNIKQERNNRHKNHKRMQFFLEMSTLNHNYISVFLGVMYHTSSSRNRPVQKYVLFWKNTKAIAFEEFNILSGNIHMEDSD